MKNLFDEIDTAYDMTGGYVDQGDLDRLLRSPTKTTAKGCLKDQIVYWLQVGPECSPCSDLQSLLQKFPQARPIARKYLGEYDC